MTIETTANYTEADFKARSFGKMIDKALEDNVVDTSEASAILDSYNKNRGEILMYTRDQLSNLQDALGISHRNKLFANREMIALKRVLLSSETGVRPEIKAEDGPTTEIKPSKLAGDIVGDTIEMDKDKKYVRLWSTDNSINLKPLNKGDKSLRFSNADKVVVEYTGEKHGNRRGIIVDGKPYTVYCTSFVETIKNASTITPDLFVSIASRYEGRYYDSNDGKDGQSPLVNGKWRTSEGATGEKPLVCSDLIREVLLASGVEIGFFNKPQKDRFDFRRVSVLEQALRDEPGFTVETAGRKPTGYQVGDIITTTKEGGATRHIGFVTKVGPQGEPLMMYHSSFSGGGVKETSFDVFRKHGKYQLTNKIRFNPKDYQFAMQNNGQASNVA